MEIESNVALPLLSIPRALNDIVNHQKVVVQCMKGDYADRNILMFDTGGLDKNAFSFMERIDLSLAL